MTDSELVKLLLAGGKYVGLCNDALLRTARWSLARTNTPKMAFKTAKRKLHQITGAYLSRRGLKRIERDLSSVRGGDASARQFCRRVLARHASNRERLPVMAELYQGLFSGTGSPATILDLACGLNPFSLPWMQLAADVAYTPLDMDSALVSVINLFMRKIGRGAPAICADILSSIPRERFDLVMILKALPCFEQQEKGVSERLLQELDASRILISFPAQSLGGHAKGMRAHYQGFVDNLVAGKKWRVEKLDFRSEFFFLINKQEESRHG